MNWFHKLIEKKLNSISEEDLIASIALCVLNFFIMVAHIFFFLFFIVNSTEMSFMNFICALSSFISIYLIVFKEDILHSVYLLILSFTYYTLWCSYYLGFNSLVAMLLPIIIVCIYSFYDLPIRDLFLTAFILLLTFFTVIYFRHYTVAKYATYYPYIEYINLAFGFIASSFIILTKRFSNFYIKKVQEEKLMALSKQANVDFLTNLWNRRYVLSTLENNKKFDKYYVVLSDIDFFKNINDTYGHNCGDYILKELSIVFSNAFDKDEIISRWGGEEFLFILRDKPKQDVINTLEEMRKSIENTTFEYQNQKFKITTSFGVNYVKKDILFDQAIHYCDEALYFAKKNGRNQTVYYDDIK